MIDVYASPGANISLCIFLAHRSHDAPYLAQLHAIASSSP